MVGFRHPRGRGDGYRPLSPGRISLPRYGSRVGLHIVLFEACSAFTRVAACTLVLSPIRDTLIEGFSHFVTSMTAPIASGWSGRRVGLAPTGKAPPFHGHKRTFDRGQASCFFEDKVAPKRDLSDLAERRSYSAACCVGTGRAAALTCRAYASRQSTPSSLRKKPLRALR